MVAAFDPAAALVVIAETVTKIENLQIAVLDARAKCADVSSAHQIEIMRLEAELNSAWKDAAAWHKRALAAEMALEQYKIYADRRANYLECDQSIASAELAISPVSLIANSEADLRDIFTLAAARFARDRHSIG